MDPNRFRLPAALFLAATGLLLTAGAGLKNKVMTTCDQGDHWKRLVHRLECDDGVISVLKTVSGSTSLEFCTEGRFDPQPADPRCSWPETLDKVKMRCDGRTSCELGLTGFRTPDVCVGTTKYLQTTFTCVEALTVVVCEGSTAQLDCGLGRTIAIYGAAYGRRDQTTCAPGMNPDWQRNVVCMQPATALVAQMCDGQSSCLVTASNAVFTDPCPGIYKYLEISYRCQPPEAHA